MSSTAADVVVKGIARLFRYQSRKKRKKAKRLERQQSQLDRERRERAEDQRAALEQRIAELRTGCERLRRRNVRTERKLKRLEQQYAAYRQRKRVEHRYLERHTTALQNLLNAVQWTGSMASRASSAKVAGSNATSSPSSHTSRPCKVSRHKREGRRRAGCQPVYENFSDGQRSILSQDGYTSFAEAVYKPLSVSPPSPTSMLLASESVIDWNKALAGDSTPTYSSKSDSEHPAAMCSYAHCEPIDTMVY